MKILILALIALAVPTSASAAISGTTETRQVVRFTGVSPKTQYSAYFYAYHYPGDPYPYPLGYGGLPSNNAGEYTASVSVSDLAANYEGGEGPVNWVKACVLQNGVELYCTSSYVGFYPEYLWTYGG